ncbi:MAG: uncharacterized protein K0S45_1911 [Nitrospira sp.]|nr:uncharacterized protein [Nitrospira sp.]
MRVSLIVMLCFTLGVAAPEAPEYSPPLVGGTVVSIEQEALSMILRMPAGDIRSFAAIDRRLFQGINVGDHVSIETNEDGMVTKLIKLPTDPSN